MSSGALAGFPVVDVVATLYDGSYHDVDSSVLAFQIAARQAFRSATASQQHHASWCISVTSCPLPSHRITFIQYGIILYQKRTRTIWEQLLRTCVHTSIGRHLVKRSVSPLLLDYFGVYSGRRMIIICCDIQGRHEEGCSAVAGARDEADIKTDALRLHGQHFCFCQGGFIHQDDVSVWKSPEYG